MRRKWITFAGMTGQCGPTFWRRYNDGTLRNPESQPMPTATLNPRDRMIETLSQQPEDSSYEALLHELAFDLMVERGLADSKAGRKISHEEMGRRIASWAK